MLASTQNGRRAVAYQVSNIAGKMKFGIYGQGSLTRGSRLQEVVTLKVMLHGTIFNNDS